MFRLTLAAVLLAAPAAAQPVDQGPKNVPEFAPAFENQTRAPAMAADVALSVETVAEGLAHPWGVEALPGGGYLVTERPGRLRHIDADGQVGPEIGGVPAVFDRRQGGLLDVALAEDFSESRKVFLTYSKPMDSGLSATAAARGTLSADVSDLTGVTDIFVQDPPSPTPMHYGSRIVLDGTHAYVTTGEHSRPAERVYAQDLDKTYGKIVRITLDGQAAEGNPFAGQEGAVDTIWTLGHRNIQGADIRPADGSLWALEHGPAGGDELNRIEPGTNYGWPVVSYGENYNGTPIGSGEPRAEGFAEPRYYWDPVIAPGGFAWVEGAMFADWEGDILAASLNPGGIVRLRLDGDTVVGEERLLPDLGRVRDIEIDSDGAILALIDAANGALVRITPAQ
ncbi:PQQ-dependent sugar dehydrogenase [Rhodobacteraceae bacterium CCMM004]|nr:PQQ-dependent sugar dehydrogenase [Rhodobacteraceae bacterium CCMM004]